MAEKKKQAASKQSPGQQMPQMRHMRKSSQNPPSRKASGGQKKFEFKVNLNLRRLLMWFLILLLFVPFFLSLFEGFGGVDEVALSDLVADIKAEKIEEILVAGSRLEVLYKDESVKVSRKEEGESLVAVLEAAEVDLTKVKIEVQDQSLGRVWWDILGTILPLVLMAAFFLFILRQARGAQDGILGFGKSKAKLFSKGKQDVSFKDVGGVEEAKKELEEIVDFLKHPRKYLKMGARTPKGVLLVGPSGTGKTLLARAVAGEAAVPFFSMAGSEFMEMLVGVGASRVRDLFDTAKKSAPGIIFIDEIDAIGRIRGLGVAGGHDEREQTLNQILVEMDGFTPNDNVIVVAATNRGDLLDPALTRPGRFDRRVVLTLPDIQERKRILKIHAKGKPFVGSVDWDRAARRTVGFSGADLENMLNEAAIQTARKKKSAIDWEEIEEAALKVKLGSEKKRLQSEYEKRMTAYHEAGHAVVTHMLPHADPVHRVSIVSRGMTLGFTSALPERDKYHQTKSELIEKIAVLLGGRTAEDIVFGELTSGAASDIVKATGITRAMVIDYGMSDLGPMAMGPQFDTTEWGRAVMEPTRLSDEMQAKVDEEIKKVITESGKLAQEILIKNRKKLDKIAEELVKNETIDGEDFEKLIGVKKVRIDEEKADNKSKKKK